MRKIAVFAATALCFSIGLAARFSDAKPDDTGFVSRQEAEQDGSLGIVGVRIEERRGAGQELIHRREGAHGVGRQELLAPG